MKKRFLWGILGVLGVVCLLPFLINSRAIIVSEADSKLEVDSKEQIPPPVEKKPTKRLGYYHYTYSSCFGGSGLGEGSFDRPVAMTVDSQNNIYIVDQENNLVQKFDKNGEFLYEWGKSGLKFGEFDSPSAIAVDKYGNVYVADTNNNRIQKFVFGTDENSSPPDIQSGSIEIDGEQVKVIVFGSMGSGEGKFQTPLDITLDDKGNIYILDAENHRIQKLDVRGEWREWGSYGSCRECFLAPTRLAYDSTGFGYVYILDQQRKGFVLHKTDIDGNFLGTLDIFHNPEYPITQPTDIYIDADGFLYILDQRSGSVYKFNTDGEFIQNIGDPSSREATLIKPQAIVQDSDKRLLIIDSKDNLIKIFDQM